MLLSVAETSRLKLEGPTVRKWMRHTRDIMLVPWLGIVRAFFSPEVGLSPSTSTCFSGKLTALYMLALDY